MEDNVISIKSVDDGTTMELLVNNHATGSAGQLCNRRLVLEHMVIGARAYSNNSGKINGQLAEILVFDSALDAISDQK